MITPDINELKDAVEDEITEAFKEFCKLKIKKLKLELSRAVDSKNHSESRIRVLEGELRGLDAQKLRKEFFEHDYRTDGSEYEKCLIPYKK